MLSSDTVLLGGSFSLDLPASLELLCALLGLRGTSGFGDRFDDLDLVLEVIFSLLSLLCSGFSSFAILLGTCE